MKKVFMVHGFMGEPNGGWRPWLMGELYKDSIYACALSMPSPNNPIKNEWVKTIQDVVDLENDEVFLVGHSLGTPAILRYLESVPEGHSIAGAVLVSGATSKLEVDNPESKIRRIDNFFETPFDFDHIKKVCKKFAVIHGDNDEKVPFSHAEKLSNALDCELISVKNGGHLNSQAGWDKLPQVLEVLQKMIK